MKCSKMIIQLRIGCRNILKVAILGILLLQFVFGVCGQTIVIRDVTLIDMVSEKPRPKVSVMIEVNRISRIGRSRKAPKDATIIDGRGKFLIPGLWDMHSHFLFEQFRDSFMKLTLSNGVTGVRDMGGEQLDQLHEIRQSIDTRRSIGPRIVAAGPLVDGPKPVFPFSIPVANADEGRMAVRTLKTKGADFVKVYSLLSRDSYFAIADEAKRQGIAFAGHIPSSVTAVEASDAGQKSIEHVQFFLDVSSDELEMRRERKEAEAKGPSDLSRVRAGQSERVLNTFSEDKVKGVAKRFARNGTWFVPTLTVHRNFAFLKDPLYASDPRLKYIPEGLRNYWKSQSGQVPDGVVKTNQLFYAKSLRIVRLFNQENANLLAGSDTMNPYVYPGFSLHDELALLVEAGLKPFEALQTATINPAVYLGREKELGTIERGKLADLVLLEANPLIDIRNTRKINAVISNGRILDRIALDKLLTQAAEQASNAK